MSGLGERKKATTVTEPLGEAASLGAQVQSPSKPVRIWAIIGGLILAFQVYVWIRWVSGPFFVRVPTGPSDPPTWMKTILITWTAVILAGWPIGIYYFIVRPWRRERRITTDGMLLVACGLLFFQDPLLNYFNTWSTYNTWMFNRGSWVAHIPGWRSYAEPGQMMAEPLLMNAAGYSYGVLLCTILGCWIMRRAKAKWPNINNYGLIGVLIIWTFFFDLVIEGMFLMPMGLFTYPGAIQSLSINAGTYYQWPIYEGLMWGGVQAGLCALRYFTDDRGRTFVERGLERIQGGFVKQQTTRFLAIFAACSLFFFVCYNLPAQWFAMNADPWPEDIQKRSYFDMGICGEGTGRLCPDPVLPIPGKDTGYIDPDGRLVLPEGAKLPEVVPFERGN
ncbi:spirocyclase AveC family protein [Nocardia abscessus]|uniref:spirocyclase AveC family protein n=1 Tax=Nocardia TaxID=1817 RepID=UPI00189334A7|nr:MULTISPECIES: spirocyclase AveC family protein [Nocardia]MBF6220544.1 spirocyclase AveC family protein [Nocardia abscessus]MDE1673473.1 spirocyclase AveC family protein [Nocardia gipuzkoensis]